MAKRNTNTGTSYTFDIIVYDNDQFVDLRSLTSEQLSELKKDIQRVFTNSFYDRMTTSVILSPQERYGELGIDTENDDPSVKVFLDFWTSPRMMRINAFTQLRFDLVDMTLY